MPPLIFAQALEGVVCPVCVQDCDLLVISIDLETPTITVTLHFYHIAQNRLCFTVHLNGIVSGVRGIRVGI